MTTDATGSREFERVVGIFIMAMATVAIALLLNVNSRLRLENDQMRAYRHSGCLACDEAKSELAALRAKGCQ